MERSTVRGGCGHCISSRSRCCRLGHPSTTDEELLLTDAVVCSRRTRQPSQQSIQRHQTPLEDHHEDTRSKSKVSMAPEMQAQSDSEKINVNVLDQAHSSSRAISKSNVALRAAWNI